MAEIDRLRDINETVRFSARQTWAERPFEFSAEATMLEFWQSGDFVHPDREGIVSFRQGGHLFIQTQLASQERFIVDLRLNPPIAGPYVEKLRVKFVAFGGGDVTLTADINPASNLYTLVSPFAALPDSVELYIDSIDPATNEASRPGFQVVFCDLTKISTM